MSFVGVGLALAASKLQSYLLQYAYLCDLSIQTLKSVFFVLKLSIRGCYARDLWNLNMARFLMRRLAEP